MSAARRTGIAMLVVVVLAAGVFIALRAWWNSVGKTPAGESCAVGTFTVDTDQAAVASTIVGTVITRGLPERAAVLVLAGALQESKLRNIPSGQGDRDSVGVLQQRPSQGWGTVAQLSDVQYAANAFLDALARISSWQTMSVADAVQTVQISADGTAYAKHESESQALADALTGTHPADISCRFPSPTQVATTAQVAAQISADLPIATPTTDATDVSVAGAGWASAAWFVANADRLGIDTVAYAQRQWSRSKGWRTASSASAAAVVATMHH
jgi:hypothetical protein